METTYFTPTSPSGPAGGARNSFLTVICILSFIGSGWGTIKAVRSYFTADYVAKMGSGMIQNIKDEVNQKDNVPDFVQQIMGSVAADMTPDFLRKLAIFSFIANLFTLSGAILMWNLNKTGFYLYVAGIVISVIAPITMGKLVGAMGGTVLGAIGVVFIVMYAVNLKNMQK